jgi:thiamine biosynthesis lipoprotein
MREKIPFGRGIRGLSFWIMAGFLWATAEAQAPSVSTGVEPTRFTYTEVHMGIEARITLYARDQAHAEEACRAAFSRIAELEQIMSDYRRDSELMRLCDQAGGPPIPISDDLFRVLARAQQVSRETHGAFDVTAGPLVQLWRAARRSKSLPAREEIEAARKLVCWRNLVLDARRKTARLKKPGMRLDLGGIAKGDAGDQAQLVLKRHGIQSAMVELGGDIVVSEPPPGRSGWIIRVPNAGQEGTPIDLPFANCAISSSGDTEQYVELGGKRYSHVVDPRTGWAVTRRTQATVIAPRGLTTDPLSTVATVLTDAEAKRLWARYPGVKVYRRSLTGP